MKVYQLLSKVPFLQKYSFKFLFIAFIGTHIPLLGIIGYTILYPAPNLAPSTILLLVLGLTLLATAGTLLLLNELLKPIELANKALNNYLVNQTLPNLPIDFTDETGVLMKNLQQSITSLDHLITENKDLVSMLSHDLRSPAASVLGMIPVLKNTKQPQETAFFHEQIEKLMRNQMELMESMLTVVRSDNTALADTDKQPVQVSKLVDTVVERLSTSLTGKRIEISYSIPAHLSVQVEPFSFTQVLMNLLQNAIKFSNPGGKIQVSTQEQEKYIQISVQDQGIGFTIIDTTELFERFTVWGRKGTEGEATHGLGLYLSKKIVDNHKGTITAYSEGANKGAAFTVILPKIYLKNLEVSLQNNSEQQ